MLAYVNGAFVPEAEASVSVHDRGFLYGDGVYEVWRTYGGRVVRDVVERNLERLRHSVRYLELPATEVVARVDAASSELVARNQEAIDATGDVWVYVVVTSGDDDGGEPSVVIMCRPIPFATTCRLEYYATGVQLVSSLMPRNPFLPVDPRVKSLSRLAHMRAQRKAVRAGPRSWVVLFDDAGHIAEATGAALCLLEGDTIVHAPRWTMLPSVSLDVFCELGAKLGQRVEARPLTLYDYLNADGVYLLATSFGAYPVVDVDGVALDRVDRVGPQIMREWVAHVGFDFTTQVHHSPTPIPR